nr:DNA mismatch repair protein MSH7 [Tanacetum cinerariifolium]
MGARLLRKWVVLPLKEVSQIQRRLDTVAALVANPELLEEVQSHLRPINDLERLISKVAGHVIMDGVDAELDELRALAFSGKDYLLKLQQREQQATGISSLKVAYNKVFGYYLE